jgi:hypothetical protein
MERDTRTGAQISLRRIVAAAMLVAALVLPGIVSADVSVTPSTNGVAGAVPAAAPQNGQGQNGQDQNGQGQNGVPGPPAHPEASGTLGSGPLQWHGGPVMHSNTTYLIFWSPGGMAAGYESTIKQFFNDVATDSGLTTNVYSTDTQYTDGSGHANYASTYGGYWEDTSTAIPDHCSSQYPSGVTVSGCVVDSDLQAEVGRAMSANGWTGGTTHIFLVFTPKNVGSCDTATSKDCAFTSYCAYHSYFTSGGQNVIYTNQPYTDTTGIGPGYGGVCNSGQQPNSNWADSTINVASHEQNESITDPLLNAWYDTAGYEDGDKCAWIFGSAIGGASGAQYNQVIAGNHYYLQEEYNNAGSNCVQNTVPPPPAPTVSGFNPPTGAPGTTVTITGSHFTGATAVKFNGTSSSFSVTDDGDINATVPSGARSGPISVTSSGGTGTSAASFVVPTPDFSLTVAPSPQTVKRGSSVSYTVTITRLEGFTGSVRLSISGLSGSRPPSATFNPSTVTGTTSTLTISTRSTTSTVTSNFTVTATSGSLRHTAGASVTVQ